MVNSWHSYPSVYAIGHRYLQDLLLDSVLVEEKVDGSQFSFGKFQGEDGEFLRCRSKGCQLNVDAPEKMFAEAVTTSKELFPLLKTGWTYRAEYLKIPKHNTLAYERIPFKHLILFDINPSEECYLSYEEKKEEAERLGLEIVPILHYGKVESLEHFHSFLERQSCLGGQKIEGVVIKNYNRFGLDKKVLMGKYVSEAFKEVHAGDWKERNPGQGDILQKLVHKYKTPARWAKAVQHLKEVGKIEDSPRDIGLIIREVPNDVKAECEAEIKADLMAWAWPHIQRGLTGGVAEWYKEELLKKQFNAHHNKEERGG